MSDLGFLSKESEVAMKKNVEQTMPKKIKTAEGKFVWGALKTSDSEYYQAQIDLLLSYQLTGRCLDQAAIARSRRSIAHFQSRLVELNGLD